MDREKAIEILRNAILINPNDMMAHNNLAGLLSNYKHDYEGSEKEYRIAIKLNPNNAVVYNNFGKLLHYNMNRYDEAKSLYQKAIEIDPKYLNVYENMNDLLDKIKNKKSNDYIRKSKEEPPFIRMSKRHKK